MSKNYALPRLIIPGKKAKDKRLYVQFGIYNIAMNRIVRKRIYTLEGNNQKDQAMYARLVVIPEITKKLIEGTIIDIKPIGNTTKLASNNTIDILEFVLRNKMVTIGTRAKQSYSYYFRRFIEFMKDEDLENCILVNFNKDYAKKFQIWLKLKGYGNRTNRNCTDTMRTLFNVLLNSANPPISKNPFIGIDRLSIGMGKNHAYQLHHRKLILDLAKSRYPSMYLVINTMFYTFMRTNELCMLQRKHIEMYHPDQIYLPSENNTKRVVERHIIITKQLKQLFIDYKIYDVPPDYYIFSRDGCRPGPNKLPTAFMGERYKNWVMNKIPELKGNKNFTLYSWKHTGVVESFKNDIKPYNIMKQTGHRNRQSFEVYLKSLGLEDNTDLSDNMPDIE